MIRGCSSIIMSKTLTMSNRAVQRLRQLEQCFPQSSMAMPGPMSRMSGDVKIRLFNTAGGSHALPTRHLAKGDALPPQREGTLRLFNMKYCPYALRARLVLAAKGVQYETINCNLKSKPEFLLERNPKGLVPVIEYKGKVMSESAIICDLLDEMYPHRPLYPNDPFSRAKDKLTIDFFNTTLSRLFIKISRNKDDDPDLYTKFFDALRRMEEDLTSRGTTFFSGTKPGMIDYMCWPWFERMSRANMAEGILSSYPALKAYIERMCEDDAVKATFIPPEEFDRFYQGLFSGNPVYDL